MLLHFSLVVSNESAPYVLDGYKSENTSYILNGCTDLRNNYTKRHDRIEDNIGNEIKSSHH